MLRMSLLLKARLLVVVVTVAVIIKINTEKYYFERI